MASLYQRENSPFWWVKCRDTNPASPTIGKIIRYSTGYKIGVGAKTRKARQLEAELTLAESKFAPVTNTEAWGLWVPGFLDVHCKAEETLKRYRTIWRNLTLFLNEKAIAVPRQLTRERCLEYLEWRKVPD